MCSGMGDWACPQPGFPIRKSSNHSSVVSSSRLIADSYVLLRLLVPRHPPCALKNLTTDNKMLAYTVQFSSYGRKSWPRDRRLLAHASGSSEGRSAQPVRTTGRRGEEACARSLRTQQCARPSSAIRGVSYPQADVLTHESNSMAN